MRRLALVPFALAASATVLAACSSDPTTSDAPSSAASSTTPSETPVSTVPTSAPVASETAASSAPAKSIDAAPAGSLIKPNAYKSLPDKIGNFTMNTSTSGPAKIYSNNGALLSVGFLSGSNYDGIVTNITKQKVRAGTGYCGSTSEVTNLTCYLKAADGVFNLSADSREVSLPELVAFTNELTTTLGTG